MTEYIGHFSLWGDFEIEDVTKTLTLQPSAVFLKGDTLEGADSPARVATWDLHCPTSATLSEQLEFLLEALMPRADVLQDLTTRFTAELNLVSTRGEGAQVLNVKAEVLQSLAKLGVGLNCFYLDYLLEDQAEYAD